METIESVRIVRTLSVRRNALPVSFAAARESILVVSVMPMFCTPESGFTSGVVSVICGTTLVSCARAQWVRVSPNIKIKYRNQFPVAAKVIGTFKTG